MQIFLLQNEQQVGPFSVKDIQNMLATGSISQDDFGWHEGLAEWQPLKSFLPIAPPPPTSVQQAAQPAATTVHTNVKQGAIIGGWVCFALGVALMFLSMWSFFIYGPLFFVAFILSIIAMSQRRIVGGVVLLLALLVVPTILGVVLFSTRTAKLAEKMSQKMESEKALEAPSESIAIPEPIQPDASPSASAVPVASPEPTPVAELPPISLETPAPSRPRRLAPDGIFYLVQRISAVTDSGIVGLAPGTRVIRVSEADGKVSVKYGEQQFDVAKSMLTNDLDVAATVGSRDAQMQAIGRAKIAAIEAQVEDQKKQADELQMDAAEKAKAASRATEINVEVIQVLSGGVLTAELQIDAAVASGLASIGGGGGVAAGATYSVTGDAIFVEGVSGVAEGQRLKLRAYPNGTYTYKDTRGATRTVAKWASVK